MAREGKSDRGGSSAYIQATRAASYIRRQTKLRPRIAVVLGTGLGAFADRLAGPVHIEYGRIPCFPVPTAAGHSGGLGIGKVNGVPVAVLRGRPHLYEGFSPQRVIFPMRVLWRLGVRAAILTNAAGGISAAYRKGSLVLLRDHINLQGTNPLQGVHDRRFGARFPDLTTVYWARYRAFAKEAAERLGLEISEGVYAAVRGPSYETPAEIGYLRAVGADLVGMSTVPEVIAAAQLGIRVLGISCVTNLAAGILAQPITEEEVWKAGEGAQEDLGILLMEVIPRIAAELGDGDG